MTKKNEKLQLKFNKTTKLEFYVFERKSKFKEIRQTLAAVDWRRIISRKEEGVDIPLLPLSSTFLWDGGIVSVVFFAGDEGIGHN